MAAKNLEQELGACFQEANVGSTCLNSAELSDAVFGHLGSLFSFSLGVSYFLWFYRQFKFNNPIAVELEDMESFEAEIESHEAAWRQKTQAEAVNVWQPLVEKATDELVAGLGRLMEDHSKKIEIVRQALLKTTGNRKFVNAFILDEIEAAAARVTASCEEYLGQGVDVFECNGQALSVSATDVEFIPDSGKKLASLHKTHDAGEDGNGGRKRERSTFKFSQFEAETNGVLEITTSATNSWVSGPLSSWSIFI